MDLLICVLNKVIINIIIIIIIIHLQNENLIENSVFCVNT